MQNTIELLYFTGDHCTVCKVLKPKLLEQVSSQFPAVETSVIDVNQERERAAQQRVFTLPVVIIQVDGAEHHRFARSFSVVEVTNALKRITTLIND